MMAAVYSPRRVQIQGNRVLPAPSSQTQGPTIQQVARTRLASQGLIRRRFQSAAEVVSWFGAVQAQEFGPARWALGLRLHGRASDAAVAQAFDQGAILRTHVMRPTWHFVAAEDIGWLLELTAPRVQRIAAGYNRSLGLDSPTLARGIRIVERALRDQQFRTRAELRAELTRGGLPLAGQALAQLMMHAELEGVVCSGPRRAKASTYALLGERAPTAARMSRDQSLAELTRRFFRSHGPATIRDFVWWSGLSTADARRGIDMTAARRMEIAGLTYWTIGHSRATRASSPIIHLLPIYDEYLVAYRDRIAVPHVHSASAPGIATFQHVLVIDGQVAGTWRPPRAAGADAAVTVDARRPLTRIERRALPEAVERYRRFMAS